MQSEYSKYDTIINLSGGVDSTYLLYEYLSKGKNLVVHHCNMINGEGRYLVEKSATRKVLNWLEENNLSTFKYYETVFDYGNLPYILKDIEVIAVFTSTLLRAPIFHHIKEIAVSANSSDESNNPNDISVVNRKAIIDTLKPPFVEAELTFPVIHISKEEMVRTLPKDLLQLTWFCRRPVYFNAEGLKVNYRDKDNAVYAGTCKMCVPCVKILPVLQELDITYDKYYL